MSAIGIAKANYDAALAGYTAAPPTATLQQLMTALAALVTAITGTSPPPKTNPDLATFNQLETFQSALASYQNQALSALTSKETFTSTDASPATDTVKFYQVVVPGFTNVPDPPGVSLPTQVTAADGSTVSGASFTGTSFLRIGSSPDPNADYANATFQRSVDLAKLVGDPSGILAAESIAVAGGAITSTAYDDSNASTLTTQTGLSTFTEGFQDGSGVQTTTSTFGTHQDPNFLLGFADDVRNRGPVDADTAANALHPRTTNVNNVPRSNTNQNRQVETLRLLTKGGWWDHSDGNRVTTTAGDKIEVIQGNYKLVVLGRQPVPTPPTPPVLPPNPTQAQTDAYNAASKQYATDLATYKTQVAALTGNTFITDVSGGHFQEQYPSPTPCIKTIEYVQDAGGEWTLYQDNGIGNLVTKLKGRTVDLFQGSKRETYVGSSSGSIDPTLDPEIVSKTWAQKITGYTGTSDKWIPSVENYTYADWIYSNTMGVRVISTTEAKGAVVSTVAAPTITNVAVGGVVTNVTAGVLKADIGLAPLNFEVLTGAKLSFGLTAVRVFGITNSVDNTKNKAAVVQNKVAATTTALAQVQNVVNNLRADIANNNLNLNNVATRLATSMNILAAQTLIA